MIKLKKNFLDKATLKSFEEILGNNFGWYYKDNSDTGGDKDPYFLHTFFQNNQVNSSFFGLIEPVLFLLKVKKLILARVNLYVAFLIIYHSRNLQPLQLHQAYIVLLWFLLK